MNNILIPFILSFLAALGTVLGSLLSFIPLFKKDAYMSIILSFSGSVMLFISVFDLLPHSIFTIYNYFNIFKTIFIILISFILGVLLIHFINLKIEEGSSLKKVGILSFISLIIHNFPEGIVTFMSSLLNINLGIKLTISILIHNIPEGLIITLPINKTTHSPIYGVGAAFLAALSEPIGAFITYLFLSKFINEIFISILLIFVSGIMIELAINNIFVESLKFNNKNYFFIGILLSLIFGVVTFLI